MPPRDQGVEHLARQLAANRRMSGQLQATLVRQSLEEQQKVEAEKMEAKTSAKHEVMQEDDLMDEEDLFSDLDLSEASVVVRPSRDESMATGQWDDEEVHFQPQPRAMLLNRVGYSTSIGGEDSQTEIIDPNADLFPQEETKNEILGVFRSWGGTEAVEAAQAGDVDKVKRAIQKHSDERVLNQNLSPRSSRVQMRDMVNRLQRIQSRLKPEKKKSTQVETPALSEARQRLAVSLAQERTAQESGEAVSTTKVKKPIRDSDEPDYENDEIEVDRAHESFVLANAKIQAIMTYRTQVGDEELSGSGMEPGRLQAQGGASAHGDEDHQDDESTMTSLILKEDGEEEEEQGDGGGLRSQPGVNLEEVAEKTAIINGLLELLSQVERK